VKHALRIGGSLALVALLLWRIDEKVVTAALTEVRWSWWLAAFLCYAVAQLVSSVRWQLLSRPLGFRHSYGGFVGFYFVGTFFNLLLPTSVGGDVVRAWYLGRGTGRGAYAATTVLADRLIGLYILVAMACVAALIVPLPGWVSGVIALFGVGGLFGLVVLSVVQRRHRSSNRRRLRELATAIAFYRQAPRLLLSASFLSLIVQVLNVALLWCLAVALQDPVSFSYCFIVMPVVAIVTLAPISVNGMGVREGAMVLLLAPIGIAAESAVTLSLLWFSVFLAGGLVGAAWYVVGRLPRCEVRNNAESVDRDPNKGRAREPATAA
jgi:uncharacterized protein (TIRG00374 family)